MTCSENSRNSSKKPRSNSRLLKPNTKLPMPNTWSRRVLRRLENCRKKPIDNLKISKTDQLKERLHSMLKTQIVKLLKLLSTPTFLLFNKQMASLMIQTQAQVQRLQLNQIRMMQKVRPKVLETPLKQLRTHLSQSCSQKAKTDIMSHQDLSSLPTPTSRRPRKTRKLPIKVLRKLRKSNQHSRKSTKTLNSKLEELPTTKSGTLLSKDSLRLRPDGTPSSRRRELQKKHPTN